MMHTGIAYLADGPALVQLSVSRHRIQVSLADGRRWQSRRRRARLIAFQNGRAHLEIAGRRWVIQMDDPGRFGWGAVPLFR